MGIGRNFMFSGILAVSNYIFPIFVYPHVSRALGVQNMGICNFVDSMIDYFILFSMLGLGSVGVREIAASGGNRHKLNAAFSTLFLIGSVTTLIALVALVVSANTIPALVEYRKLLMIGTIKLVGNFLMLDWLFRGLEDFKYITYRTLIIKFIYVVAVFIWIWHPQDYQLYYVFVCLMVGVNSVFSCVYASKLVRFTVKGLNLSSCLRQNLIMGLYMFLTSMYVTFNTVYLGLSTNDVQVGYYTTASKFFSILVGLYGAYTTVMLPRMSALLSEGKIDEFKQRMSQSVGLIMLVGIPLVVFMMCFSRQVILIFSGAEYLPAASCALLVFPLILIIGLEQILIIQVLLPLNKEKALLIGSAVGASVSVCLNFLLVRRFGAIGSSVVWLSSEIVVLGLAQFFVRRYVSVGIPFGVIIKNCIMYIPLAAILVYIAFNVNVPPVVSMMIGGVIAMAYWLILQLKVLKNPYLLLVFNRLNCRN